MTQDRDTLAADIDPSGSGDQALDLDLLFAAKGANQLWPPFFIEALDDVRLL